MPNALSKKVFFSFLLALTPLFSFTYRDSFAASLISFCKPPNQMGYFVQISNNRYKRGEIINFCLINNTRSPIFLQPNQPLPWEVVNVKNNEVVYRGKYAGTSIVQMQSPYFDKWNQVDNKGKEVKPGMYKIVFVSSINQAFALFDIK